MEKIDDRKIEYILTVISDYLQEGLTGFALSSKISYLLLDSELNCSFYEIDEISEYSRDLFNEEVRIYIFECLESVMERINSFKEILMSPSVLDQLTCKYSWFNTTFDEDFKFRIKILFGFESYKIDLNESSPLFRYDMDENDKILSDMLDFSLCFNREHVADSRAVRLS